MQTMAFVVLMGVTVVFGLIAMALMEYDDYKSTHSTN